MSCIKLNKYTKVIDFDIKKNPNLEEIDLVNLEDDEEVKKIKVNVNLNKVLKIKLISSLNNTSTC